MSSGYHPLRHRQDLIPAPSERNYNAFALAQPPGLEPGYNKLTACRFTIRLGLNIVTKFAKIRCGPALYVLRPTLCYSFRWWDLIPTPSDHFGCNPYGIHYVVYALGFEPNHPTLRQAAIPYIIHKLAVAAGFEPARSLRLWDVNSVLGCHSPTLQCCTLLEYLMALVAVCIRTRFSLFVLNFMAALEGFKPSL